MSTSKILPFSSEATIAVLSALDLLIEVSMLTAEALDEVSDEWYDVLEDLNNWKGALASLANELRARNGVTRSGSRSPHRDEATPAARSQSSDGVGAVREDSQRKRKRWQGESRSEVHPSEADFRGLEGRDDEEP